MNRFKQFFCKHGILFFFLLTVPLTVPGTFPGYTLAADADAMTKEVNKQLRDAERMMFNGKNEEALQLLNEISVSLDSIRKDDPDHKRLKSLQGKYDRIKGGIEKKLGKASPPSPAGKEQASTARQPAAQADKLPGGVSKRIRDIDRELDIAERMMNEGSMKNARYQYGKATTLFSEIDERYAGQFSKSHPEYAAARERYVGLEEKIHSGEQQLAAEKERTEKAEQAQVDQSREWVDKFTPYIANPARKGHDPDKYLVFPGTTQPEAMKKMEQVYEELKALYEQYKKTEFPNGRTWEIEQAAKDVEMALEDFYSSFASGAENVMEVASQNISRATARMENDTKWMSDPEEMPAIVDSRWKERIDEAVNQVEEIYSAGDPALAELKEKYEKMLQLDREHRQVRAERTFVRQEIYKGQDLKEIRNKAEAIVEKERPEARILRISVYKDEWKEERVLEPTDSTNTAIRYRVTRMINAQAAVKEDGKVYLLTLHIAKDKQDNGWGGLYGHIMYSDPMAEKNVNK